MPEYPARFILALRYKCAHQQFKVIYLTKKVQLP